ncbi:MAG: UvrD-helicase domain-containing protein [Thiotrichales bacterium]|nr:MAG: UvrD-helicase domain-containing protein [Thiotrichales bacterium]
MNPTNSPDTGSVDSLDAADPEKNATVSASAGTGKTWLLVTRIIRLLLADTEPGSILALTFTRKAAAEMQIRLQERLYQMATADDKELTGLLKQFGSSPTTEACSRARELYEKLLHAKFQVRLQTFHSFCQDILSHFPLEADITPGFELIENTALLQQQAWEELFADATRNAQGPLASDLDILMHACNGPANTKSALYSMLGHRSDWWAYSEDRKDAAAYASAQLQQQLQIDVNTDPFAEFFTAVSREDLTSFEELLRRHKTKTNLDYADRIALALQAESLDEDAFRQLLPVYLKKNHEPRSRKPSKTQAASMGSDAEAMLLDLHQRISESMQQALEVDKRARALELNAVWYRTGQRFIDLYQRLKREQRVLDFTDLEWNCYQLLNDVDNAHWVQYKIDQRINHVLIDEFQDTNPTQWQLITPLLEEIAAGPGERARSFFLVGDEKQSIYSFRRANPKLQQQAADYLAQQMAAIAVKLDASRRSSPAIMDVVNAIFIQDEIHELMPDFTSHSTHLPNFPGRVSLFPLHEADSDEDRGSNSPDPVSLRNPLLEPRAEQREKTRRLEANQIAEQIEQLISEKQLISVKDENDNELVRPIEYGDVMILMRNRTHVSEYEAVLRDRHIPFIGSQRGSLLDNQEIQDLEKLLDSLITPFNNLSIAQVLKSPIFAASDEDLVSISLLHKETRWYQRLLDMKAELPDEQPLGRAAKLLPHWHRLADTMPVHDLLDRIYVEGNIMQRYAASVPASRQQRVCANLQRFHELSLELDSGRYPSLSHFLHYLRSIRGHRDGRPDEPPVAHGRSRVNLMTIHASKGLEAPVVILADCDNQGGHHNAYSALVDWPAQSRRPEKFQLITGKASTDEMTRAALAKKEKAQKREELNLLYVAITRARQYLIVTGSASKSSSGWYDCIETAMQTLATTDDSGAYHYATGGYVDTVASSSKPPTLSKIEVDTRLTRPIQNVTARERMIAPSRSYDTGEGGFTTSHDSDGNKRGIAIHRAIDFMSRVPPLTEEQTRQRIRHEFAVTDKELDSWIDEARKTVQNSGFEQIFNPVGYQQTLNELPIMYRHNNQSVYGLIDRVVINDGDILLIDYKTHQLDDQAQLQTLARGYAEQMRYYRTGVDRLWPGRQIKSGLLFTHSARLVWLDVDA